MTQSVPKSILVSRHDLGARMKVNSLFSSLSRLFRLMLNFVHQCLETIFDAEREKKLRWFSRL
jgi:hypothetical protein